jgi:hypothetical protein
MIGHEGFLVLRVLCRISQSCGSPFGLRRLALGARFLFFIDVPLLHLMFESGALLEGDVGAAAPCHLPGTKPGPVELLQQFLFRSSFLALVDEACNLCRVQL